MRALYQQIFIIILCGWMASFLTNCASTEQQEGDLLEEGNQGSESTNNESGDEFSGEQGGESENQGFQIGQGEEVNNASENEFADNNLNLGNQGQGQQAKLTDEQVAEQTAEIGNQVNANLGASNVAANGLAENAAATPTEGANLLSGNAAAVANPAATNTATPALAPTGSGSVKYVRSSIQATDQPGSGNVVKTLEKGDHPLIFDEGEFGKMSNGTYIPLQSLSVEGVGRDRSTNNWQGR